MIKRTIESKLKQLYGKFPIVSLTGPRQSGKTTLIKNTFKNIPYVSLENPEDREFAIRDPKGFLNEYPKGVILDEIQRVPELFSWLQGIVDNDRSKKYIISGSQNFLLSQQISQSLAGRVAILTLLPLSLNELEQANLLGRSFPEVAYKGFYPGIFDRQLAPEDFYPNYVHTYVERDVRQLKQVGDLHTFTTFLKLCAGRAGQLINLSELSNDTGIAVNTVKSWLNILEASYIIFRLYPHHKNYNKRLIKMPKIYFYDTGLLCYLLGIKDAAQIQVHFAKGAVFENLVIADLLKKYLNSGRDPQLYFWRDHRGKEIDLLIEKGVKITPVEIKSGETKSMEYFKNLIYWNRISGFQPENAIVVYGGNESRTTKAGRLISWKSLVNKGFFSEK